MVVAMLCVAVLALLVGGVVWMGAQSAIHEIEAGVMFIVSAVLFAGSGVMSAVERLRRDVGERLGVRDGSAGVGATGAETQAQDGDGLGVWVVSEDQTVVKERPHADGDVIGQHSRGTQVSVYGKTEGWRRISPDGRSEQWVLAREIKPR